MDRFFVRAYDFFSGRKALMWTVLLASAIAMGVAAYNVRYVEDITNFFPKQQQDISLIYDNIPSKDRFIVMFTAPGAAAADAYGIEDDPADMLIACAEYFAERIGSDEVFARYASFSPGIDDSIIESMSGMIYDNLPLFLGDADYDRLDSLFTPGNIAIRMRQNYDYLLSPIGGFVSEYLYKDPMSLGSGALKELQNQGNTARYILIGDYIFSQDGRTLICYVEPLRKLSGAENRKLIDVIEQTLRDAESSHSGVDAEYFGAAAVAEYNARQIKRDTMVTLNIAVLAVILLISFAFRNKYSILFVLLPVVYGALFALSLIRLISGEISLIAVGSGSVVFGIALSYSIHVLSHANHCADARQLIAELAHPLTIGSFTTIGAFAGLLFTNSRLLQDFGLFSSLTLVGTTLFSLLFMPHLLSVGNGDKRENRLSRLIDRISGIRIDRSKPLVWTIVAATAVLWIFFNKTGFDSDMMKLNYQPEHLKNAEQRLGAFTGNDGPESTVIVIASAADREEAVGSYKRLCATLDSLRASGTISSYSSIDAFVIPDSVQARRLARWNGFWNGRDRAEVGNSITAEADRLGFEPGSFAGFDEVISKEYGKLSYDGGFASLFPEWTSSGPSITSFIAQMKLADSLKTEVYALIASQSGAIVADRAFFAGRMAQEVSHNFNLILYISGLLILLALLLSYGRIELTLISFLPMFMSWVIILGIMCLFGVEFNIVTIILSTFIFGIGDDFSIFLTDGLLNEYRDRSRILERHKTAIFFSAFAIIAGMGALVFAKHPAMRSLGEISLIGIIVVVAVACSILPWVFRSFITSQTARGGFPYTAAGLLNTVYAFGLFVLGCSVIQTAIMVSYLVPVGGRARKGFIHRVTSWSTRNLLRVMATTRTVNINPTGETFRKPAVIIANHQSFIDILILLALRGKFVMVTNGWVWKSPFFGRIVRYLDFHHTGNGYETLAESLRGKVEQGYSIVIFPEGTRSPDCKIKRFHKGAFYLAQQLELDIVPILLYGNGLVSSKRQPLYIKKGLLVSKILPRIPCGSTAFGTGYRERAKNISAYFREEYDKLYGEFNRASNPYFRDALIKNYIYKGPVLEWYMRIKLRLERWYDRYDRLLPREGHIVDLGCGYGAMSLMLAMLSDRRRVTAVDYDLRKISLAANCFAGNDNVAFIHADIREYDIPRADGYVISDVLHYVSPDAQRMIVEKCVDRLNEGGVIVIKDGDSSADRGHALTEATERWSTRIMKFNKTDGPLSFLSREQIADIARDRSMDLEIARSGSKTSNTLFILTRKKDREDG